MDAEELFETIIKPVLAAVAAGPITDEVNDPSFGVSFVIGQVLGAAGALDLLGVLRPEAAEWLRQQPSWPAHQTPGQLLAFTPNTLDFLIVHLTAARAQQAATTGQDALPSAPGVRTALVDAEIGRRAGHPVILQDVIAWPDRTELRWRIVMPRQVHDDDGQIDRDATRALLEPLRGWFGSRLLTEDDAVLHMRGATRGFVGDHGFLITEVFGPVPVSSTRLSLEIIDQSLSEAAGRAVIELI